MVKIKNWQPWQHNNLIIKKISADNNYIIVLKKNSKRFSLCFKLHSMTKVFKFTITFLIIKKKFMVYLSKFHMLY